MSSTEWTSVQAWDDLMGILQAPDILNDFANAVGKSDIDDFMYLGSYDLETLFEVTATGTTMEVTTPTHQSLTRVG